MRILSQWCSNFPFTRFINFVITPVQCSVVNTPNNYYGIKLLNGIAFVIFIRWALCSNHYWVTALLSIRAIINKYQLQFNSRKLLREPPGQNQVKLSILIPLCWVSKILMCMHLNLMYQNFPWGKRDLDKLMKPCCSKETKSGPRYILIWQSTLSWQKSVFYYSARNIMSLISMHITRTDI